MKIVACFYSKCLAAPISKPLSGSSLLTSKIETGYKPTHSRYLVYLECGRANPHGLECFWNNRNVIDRVMIENGKEWIRKG